MPREASYAKAASNGPAGDDAGTQGPIKAGASVDLGIVVSVYGRGQPSPTAGADGTCFAPQAPAAGDTWATEH